MSVETAADIWYDVQKRDRKALLADAAEKVKAGESEISASVDALKRKYEIRVHNKGIERRKRLKEVKVDPLSVSPHPFQTGLKVGSSSQYLTHWYTLLE